MQKVYDIKIKDLECILTMLKDNMFDELVYMDAIKLEGYINRIKNKFNNVGKTDVVEQIHDDLECYSFYKPLYPFVEKFAYTGKDIGQLDDCIEYKSILFGDKQVVDDVTEFYRQQGELFYSQFLEYINEVNDHLKFIHGGLNTDGEALCLKSIGEAFVFAPNYSNITKFTILVHEVQHVIDFYINPDFSDEYLIRETIAMFMEMIASDFIVKKYKLYGEGFKRQQYLHSVVKFQSHDVIDKMDILEIASKHKNVSDKKLFDIFSKEYFTKDEVKFYFEQGIASDFCYQLAYLIAIELYMIYYNDKDYAIKICEDIIVNGTSNNIFEVLDKYDITLNSSVIPYENKIYKKRY